MIGEVHTVGFMYVSPVPPTFLRWRHHTMHSVPGISYFGRISLLIVLRVDHGPHGVNRSEPLNELSVLCSRVKG